MLKRALVAIILSVIVGAGFALTAPPVAAQGPPELPGWPECPELRCYYIPGIGWICIPIFCDPDPVGPPSD